jgi:hypothetical protein
MVTPTQADLLMLKELCETGKVKPVIDRRYIEAGHASGKVVVTVS